jgi:hypothetical protein
MNKNIFKKLIFILSFFLIFSQANFIFAEDLLPEIIVPEVPVINPININLKIISGSEVLYDSDILVNPCDSEGDGVIKITPYCALAQSGISSDWSGLWINSIGDFSNDFTTNLYWMWLSNLNIDNTNPNSSYNLSAKQYEVNEGDEILFYYNTNPLSLSVNNLNPNINEEIIISLKELGLDNSWNPVWKPAPSSSVFINDNSFDTDENGEYKFVILNTDQLIVNGKKANFIDSPLVTINPVDRNQNEEEVELENNDGGGGGSSHNNSSDQFLISSAVSFLSLNQKDDGSFGDSLYTDWVAIGISKAGIDAKDLISDLRVFLENEDFKASSITDYERHAMALMSLGINPYSGTDTDYIKNIVDSFDGEQIGESNLFNDDIFGIIVLDKVGYDENDEIILKTISYIISKQSTDGSWGSVDMTAASLIALKNFNSVEGVSDAIFKAEDYLINLQQNDGSFENPFSTSWAIQALLQNNSYLSEVENSIKYLASKQQIDGGLDGNSIDNRVWATAYAVPAALLLSWNDILESFEREVKIIDIDKVEDEGDKVIEEKIINEIKDEIIKDDLIKIEDKKEEKLIVLEKKIYQNKEIEKQGIFEETEKNPLIANVLIASEKIDDDSFDNMIFKIIFNFKRPFVWLWNLFNF